MGPEAQLAHHPIGRENSVTWRKLGLWGPLLAILILALAVRLVLLSHWHHEYYFAGITIGYGDIARSLGEGQGITTNAGCGNRIATEQVEKERLIDWEYWPCDETPVYRPFVQVMPGYAFLLAATWRVFGKELYIYAQIVQVILDSLLTLLIFYVAARWFSRNAGLLAAFLYAIYLPQAFLSSVAMRDVWVGFVVVGILALAVRFPANRSLFARYSSIGVLAGAGAYMSSGVALLPLAIGLADSFSVGLRRAALGATVSMLCVTYLLMPWIIRNYEVYDRFIPLRGGAKFQTIWEGWGEFEDNPFGAILSDGITYKQAIQEGFQGDYAHPDYDDFMREKVVRAIKSDPVWVATAMLRRIPHFVILNLQLGFGVAAPDEYVQARQAGRRNAIRHVLQNPELIPKTLPYWSFKVAVRAFGSLFFLFAMFSFWRLRHKYRVTLPLLTLPLYYWVVIGAYHYEPRYFVGSTIPYVVLISVGVVSLWADRGNLVDLAVRAARRTRHRLGLAMRARAA